VVAFDSIEFHLFNRYYESAASLARAIERREFVEDTMTASLPVSSFFVDMNDVFERAIR
jgi:hypothetical protein